VNVSTHAAAIGPHRLLCHGPNVYRPPGIGVRPSDSGKRGRVRLEIVRIKCNRRTRLQPLRWAANPRDRHSWNPTLCKEHKGWAPDSRSTSPFWCRSPSCCPSGSYPLLHSPMFIRHRHHDSDFCKLELSEDSSHVRTHAAEPKIRIPPQTSALSKGRPHPVHHPFARTTANRFHPRPGTWY
jgi:hypothetical protein